MHFFLFFFFFLNLQKLRKIFILLDQFLWFYFDLFLVQIAFPHLPFRVKKKIACNSNSYLVIFQEMHCAQSERKMLQTTSWAEKLNVYACATWQFSICGNIFLFQRIVSMRSPDDGSKTRLTHATDCASGDSTIKKVLKAANEMQPLCTTTDADITANLARFCQRSSPAPSDWRPQRILKQALKLLFAFVLFVKSGCGQAPKDSTVSFGFLQATTTNAKGKYWG